METGNKHSDSQIRILSKLIKFVSLSLMALMIAGSTNNVSAAVVWYEDFDDNSLDGLDLYRWDSASGVNVDMAHGFNIVDGALKAPSSSDFNTKSRMIVDSSVANGTWSFDLKMSETEDTHVIAEYILTDLSGNYNLSGRAPTPKPWAGYAIIFASHDGTGDIIGPGLTFIEYDDSLASGWHALKTQALPKGNMTGTHHIDITRDLMGETKVYYDFKLQFSFSDTTTISSEKFGFTSFMGGASIDNIRVSDTIEEINLPTSDTGDTHTIEADTTMGSETSSDRSENGDSPISLWTWITPVFLAVVLRRIQKGKNK